MLLETSGIIILVQLHYKNFKKRIIKSSKTFNQDFFKGINYWIGLKENTNSTGIVIYGGDRIIEKEVLLKLFHGT